MTQNSADLARALPKADLHLHLDGSLRPATLLELAAAADVPVPAADEAALLRDVYPPRYASLPHYLDGFRWTIAVMRTPQAVERIARELVEDCAAVGVRYVEVRFSPELFAGAELPMVEVLQAAARGMAQAESADAGDAFPLRTALIVCALRDRDPAASSAACAAAIAARDVHRLPVVGFDLAGPERGFPAGAHAEVFRRAADAGLGITVHAGEDDGPESIRAAWADCGAQRLGHGVRVLEDPALTAELAAAGVPLEVCVTSNLQTHPEWRTPAEHPLRALLAAGLEVTLNTDNTLVSRTDLAREAQVACEAAALKPAALTRILRGAFHHAFFPGTSTERAAWLREVDAAYASAPA